jgi:hypothetical protein
MSYFAMVAIAGYPAGQYFSTLKIHWLSWWFSLVMLANQ